MKQQWNCIHIWKDCSWSSNHKWYIFQVGSQVWNYQIILIQHVSNIIIQFNPCFCEKDKYNIKTYICYVMYGIYRSKDKSFKLYYNPQAPLKTSYACKAVKQQQQEKSKNKNREKKKKT